MSEDTLAEISAMVREHLAWEAKLGGVFLPSVAIARTEEGSDEPQGDAAPRSARPPTQARTEAPPARTDPTGPSRSQSTASSPSPPAASPPAASPPAASPPAASPQSQPASEPARSPVQPDARTRALPLAPEERHRRLAALAEEVSRCTRCGLHETRTQTVFARGSATAEVAFVGEGPGFHEDQQGFPFVGKAGQLLDRMIGAMGYGRDEVYVCNVVKCRPPDNRTPLPDEAAACEPFLTEQLGLVGPQVIVALGRCASDNLRGQGADPQSPWRGVWARWREIPMMSTYHPAFLLRSPEMKRPVWEDLQKVLERLGRKPPPRG